MGNVDITQVLLSFQEAGSLKELRSALIAFLTEQGVVMAGYRHSPPPGATPANLLKLLDQQGFPDYWAKEFIEQRYYEIDPFTQEQRVDARVYWWSELPKTKGLTEHEKAYVRHLTESGLGEGIAFPVFGPHGRNGCLIVGFGNVEKRPSEETVNMIRMACQFAHHRICVFVSEKIKKRLSLSEREIEVLAWMARGKSNSVIADIIGVSAHTVNTYVKRLFAKLNVNDRVTAAFRGYAMGVLA